MIRQFIILFSVFLILPIISIGQLNYIEQGDKTGFSFDTYGRVGVDWNYDNGGSIGRRLNLNNMGSIGGRLEEQDYLELVPTFHFKPFNENDLTKIKVQTRFAVYSKSLSLFGNSSTSSLGGLTIAMPEIYAEASNINGKDLSIWIGARLYRKGEVHIADHFFFDDHSGQGFGIEYKNTRFASIFVSSTDTTADVPPYFYLNIGDGVANIALRQRNVLILEHDFQLSENNKLTGLFEFHRMGGTESDPIPEPRTDNADVVLNYSADHGFVYGLKLQSDLPSLEIGAYNTLAVRYGTSIANGGDGGLTKTWITFGAPDLDKLDYSGAYSLAIVDEVKFDISEENNLNAYLIFTQSKGAADTKGMAETYWGREVYNYKQDLTIGFRDVHYVTDKFHLLSEFHYSQRKDGEDPKYCYQKISLAPTFAPTGEKSTGVRPHFRFIFSLSHYNDAASENLYSPYLQFVGEQKWGHYLGVKAEWWL
ncbi:carbohydrate porin [uncultured Draconibacterium sp.]|mgnify:CR=1 FL=1|uniref:carbohydrate porin n=1 Tax=uncultured Draconibacterium sp. TaxID=1573823 RepID=UPI0025D02EEC|nr:carbohydrate porin [uncultured Draconibacterium sp.]